MELTICNGVYFPNFVKAPDGGELTLIPINQTSSQQYNYTYQIDFLDNLSDIIDLDEFSIDDLQSNTEDFKPITYEQKIAYQYIENEILEAMPFLPVGERYISLIYNVEVFVTVVYALRVYLVIRAFKMKVFTLGTYAKGRSE
jgi:hypothetical protein